MIVNVLLMAYVQVNDKCGVLTIFLSTLSKIRNSYFKHYIKKRVGDNFSRCGKCYYSSTYERFSCPHMFFKTIGEARNVARICEECLPLYEGSFN